MSKALRVQYVAFSHFRFSSEVTDDTELATE